jgi:hypothetical protein
MKGFLEDMWEIFRPTNYTQVLSLYAIIAWIVTAIIIRKMYGSFWGALRIVGFRILFLGIIGTPFWVVMAVCLLMIVQAVDVISQKSPAVQYIYLGIAIFFLCRRIGIF